MRKLQAVKEVGGVICFLVFMLLYDLTNGRVMHLIPKRYRQK